MTPQSRSSIPTIALVCILGLFALAAYFSVTGAASMVRPPALTTSAMPPTPTIIAFDPPLPSVFPGTRITVQAKVLDEHGAVIAGAGIASADVDPGSSAYLNVTHDSTSITIIGLAAPAKATSLPRMASIIVKSATAPAVESVLNVQLGTSAPPAAPIPTGSPQVDVMWAVLPKKIVRDNFGLRVRDQYYAIGIVIGNNSGYSLQLASVGFTVPHLNNPACPPSQRCITPAANYQITRGTVVREEVIGWRAVTLNALPALGSVLSGLTPFFHAINHKANFNQFVSLFTGQIAPGVGTVWPDTISGHLVSLDEQALRNDNKNVRTVIDNNTQYASVTFFPRHFLDSYFEDDKHSCNKECQKNRDDPEQVMEALGNMVIVGQQIEYVNRISLAGNSIKTTPQTFSISGTVTECDVIPGVTIKLTGDPTFTARTATTDSKGNYKFDAVPAGGSYQLAPQADANFTFPGVGPANLTLNGDLPAMDFKTVLATNAVKVTVFDGTGTALPGAHLTLTPTGGAAIAGTTGSDGSYFFLGLAAGTYALAAPGPPARSFLPSANLNLGAPAGRPCHVQSVLAQ